MANQYVRFPNLSFSGAGIIQGSGTAGQVAYFDSTSTITSSANLPWDGTTLGVTGNITASLNITATTTFDAGGVLSVTGSGNTIGTFRKDQNAKTAINVFNANVGASANTELRLTNDTDDFRITVDSLAGGNLASIIVNSGLAGLNIVTLGTDLITLKTNNTTAISIDGTTQAVTIPVGLGLVTGSVDANNILAGRKDQNTATRGFIQNSDAGASAITQLKVVTNAGDVILQAGSTASGAAAYLVSDTGYTGGLNIGTDGANPLTLRTNSGTALTIDGTTKVGTFVAQVRAASLGVGNSAAATIPGTVTKKIEVFDASGASLGFIAVYDAIV